MNTICHWPNIPIVLLLSYQGGEYEARTEKHVETIKITPDSKNYPQCKPDPTFHPGLEAAGIKRKKSAFKLKYSRFGFF